MRLHTAFLFVPVCLLAQSQEANSNVIYRALRDGKLAESYTAENIALERDAATVTFKSGELSFLAPVLGRQAVALFTGRGQFHLKPAPATESARLQFTDGTVDEVRQQAKTGPVSPKNEAELRKFRAQLRSRTETPRSSLEAEMFGASIPNLDAQVLTELYNPAQAGSFMVLLHGRKHPQLRFLLRPQGAIPGFGPEEVALVNMDPGGQQDGIWYLAHSLPEIRANAASSSEEKRLIAPEHYRMDVRVGRHDRLAAKTSLRFKALRDGDRVVHLNLLPNLRVSRASLDGAPMGYIQEGAKQDGALYLILSQPTVKDSVYTAEMEYEGDKVIFKEGEGNYSVEARENWYPSASIFRDWATYDITFHSPRKLTLVSVGKLTGERRDGGEVVTEWRTDQPLPVAGFNYGNFKKKERADEASKYSVEAYATTEPPDFLKYFTRTIEMGPHVGDIVNPAGMMFTPSAMAEHVLVDALDSVRLFTQWYGPAPFGRLAVTQQPAFNFGQSWPTLIYLPVSAFLDSTQRWQLLGRNTFRFSKEFINVLTAHEVSHQWWGDAVGWASYHDQWRCEGVADFSAALFLEATHPKDDDAQKFWESERRLILEKNAFGNRANDVGPLWMGQRLDSFKAPDAYRRIIYAKGAFVLNMLRHLMQDGQTGGKNFIDMMHDFMAAYRGKNPATEDFQRIVEKHMRPEMNLDGNGRMDWFFREWVYGTEIPSYRLEYTLGEVEGGKTLLTMKISQQDVGPSFKMRVPAYADFDGHLVKLGTVAMTGSATSNELKVTLGKRPRACC